MTSPKTLAKLLGLKKRSDLFESIFGRSIWCAKLAMTGLYVPTSDELIQFVIASIDARLARKWLNT